MIYDHDGTAAYPIAYLYDSDGTTGYPIAYVYDHDGTAGYLVYTVETVLYPSNKILSINTNYGTSGSVSGFSLAVNSTTANDNARIVYLPVTLTNYKTLRIKASITGSSGTPYLGIVLAKSLTYAYYTVGSGSSASNYALMKRASGVTSWSGELVWDVSGLTGSYYLALQGYSNTTTLSAGTVAITQVVAEE